MYINRQGLKVDIQYVKDRIPGRDHTPEWLDKLDYKPISPWERTFVFFPTRTITGNKKYLCFLYKRDYLDWFGQKASMYAESEFEIIKLDE